MNIFVGNLAFSATDHALRQLFEPYGAVDKINIITAVSYTHLTLPTIYSV